MICFTILEETLCGKPYKEPSKKAAKDGRLCDDCVQVMWKEQYRRNTLMSYIKKAKKAKKGTKVIDSKSESVTLEPVRKKSRGLYLRDYLTI